MIVRKYMRSNVSEKDFENAADWVRCMDQREDPFFPSLMSDESRRMTDREFAEHQEWMRGRSVSWMESAMLGQRVWVLDAAALLIRTEGRTHEIFPKEAWEGIEFEARGEAVFDSECWKIVRSDRSGYGLAVPRGLTNRLRKCERIAREYAAEIRAGDCDYDSLLSKLRNYWRLFCEAEDIMVPDLPDMSLGYSMQAWCEHNREKTNGWAPNQKRWNGEE